MSVATRCSRTSSTTSHLSSIFFFSDTATTEIYTLSLHDALPIFGIQKSTDGGRTFGTFATRGSPGGDDYHQLWIDRKSTRLNSSHVSISYAVFCLKKKNHTVLFQLFHDVLYPTSAGRTEDRQYLL